jgi:NAD(P)-dependent dehydrogenase (short-subunit alcohol dehydrogenase family)
MRCVRVRRPHTAKTWFITGSSRGLGRALTERLLERGDRVAATLRTPARHEDLVERYGAQLWVRELDVCDVGRMREVVDEAFAHFERVDVVVSNAGYAECGALEELTDEQIERQLQTNLVGGIQLARAVLPHLRAQGGGHLMQLSSTAGQTAFPAMGIYCTTKWGLEGFYETLAVEVAPFGIRATLVLPGSVRNEFLAVAPWAEAMADYAAGPAGQMRAMLATLPSHVLAGDPAKMADAMIAAVESGEPPLRLLCGSDAYTQVQPAMAARLAEIEAQRETCGRTDADDWAPPAATA